MTITAVPATDAELTVAREWLMDCAWADIDSDEIADVAACRVYRAVSRHYEGGWPAFRADVISVGGES